MKLVDMRAIIDRAEKGGYAIGAFNMHNDETCEALVVAAEQAKSPVILQVGRAIIPHMGVERGYELTRRIAERSDAEVVIHLDHGSWDEVIKAIRLGFTSIMYDGAHLPFEENIKTTRRVVEMAHDFGIPLVLHGASGLTEQEVRDAREAGVCKFNADTDLRHAFRRGFESVWAKGDRQLEEAMAEGRKLMIPATVEKMRQYGCAGTAGA